MVRASHDHHSSGPWSLKDRADSIVSTGTRGRTVSTRILGIGIILVGVLFLAVGLIMGLEFPNFVHKQIKEKQCVVYPGHEKYTSWSDGSQWNRKVSLYYWTLVNADDFLYKGYKPWFVQKGPYVYKQTENKYDVNFALTEVTYRLHRQHVFDREATELACSSCNEHDQLTILNPWYLKTVGQYGGEETLMWSHISTYTINHLTAAGLIYQELDDIVFNENSSILGTYTTESPTDSSQTFANVSFGLWLYSSTNNYKFTIETWKNRQDFSLSEVKSLYKVLTSVTLLGGVALTLPDHKLQRKCKLWARILCSQVPYTSTFNVGIEECGVIYLLHKCHGNISTEAWNTLQLIFCSSNIENACLNLTSLPEDISLAYINAISDFLWHLFSVVFESLMSSTDMGLVISLNQSQLALGYDVTGDYVLDGFRVTGLLQSNWIGDTSGTAQLWKVYTCLENRNMNNNMKVKEYNNSWLYLGGQTANSYKISVSSFTDFVTSCSGLSTCQTCSAPGSSLNIFVEDLLRATSFLLNSSTSMNGVRVFRYELDPNTFSSSNMLKIANNIQNMADVAGYFSWASSQLTEQIDHMKMEQTTTPTNSYVLIEPVTGRVWEKTIKLQWNVGISNDSAHIQDRNISVTELPLPLIWVERTTTVVNYEIIAHKHLVTRLLSVSCGGVIGFSVVAIIIVIIGIVVCLYPSKPNRISPLMEDSTNSLPNGRHL